MKTDTIDTNRMSVERYHRQTLLPQIGKRQALLGQGRVLILGCGALGTVVADQLARAGVGYLRLVDRDVVEATNLQRQVLFAESDIGAPKAVAAGQRIACVNSEIQTDARIVDVHSGNIETLMEGTQLVLDGTDNVATRYLLNDVCVKKGLPWVYGACVGTEGRVMPILPDQACLRCIFPTPPGASELPTCDTAGVLGSAANIVGSLQAALAIKILIGEPIEPALTAFDAWTGRFHAISITNSRRADCPCCGKRNFEFLDRASDSEATLCGRNAVQIRPGKPVNVDLAAVAGRLESLGTVERSAYLLRCRFCECPEIEFTLFPDGRAIVGGTHELRRARTLYAKYIGM